jgi:hypothetical protein
MGFFTPKISAHDLEYVTGRMNQLQDTIKLVNTTVKPDIFFKRLNFALDILLDLQQYEKYRIFKQSTPSSDYRKIVNNMEEIVDDFLDRAIANNEAKIASLKTAAAKTRNLNAFVDSLAFAFDHASSLWPGDRGKPHYSGPLYTKQNLERVHKLFNENEF